MTDLKKPAAFLASEVVDEISLMLERGDPKILRLFQALYTAMKPKNDKAFRQQQYRTKRKQQREAAGIILPGTPEETQEERKERSQQEASEEVLRIREAIRKQRDPWEP